MPDQAAERVFQNDIIKQMLANGWQLGQPEKYIGEKFGENSCAYSGSTRD